MEPGEAVRQGLGSVNKARKARTPTPRESSHDSEEHGPRIAQTLAACCRCRQRKTRCDPTLPRCISCERAGALCEYFDTAKGKRISRTYVIRLQDKVRALEAELSQITEDDEAGRNTEDSIRPGGLVRLNENDDTPRYLGPSSGIAMTRLVMEEAKRYTESRSIRELVPEVGKRRTPISYPAMWTERKKSYPMISAVPADKLPSRLVTDKLVEVFTQRAQYLFPTIHEPTLEREVDDVYNGDTDDYKNFVLRMVLAISMQKLDTQYAGLADSYYLAAMAYIEAVIRPKDLRTVQCLILIGQYSLLTPTRTAIYYIIGLATRICQQLGLSEEKTIAQGVSMGLVDPAQMDMKRRLSWCVFNMESGLSHSLGRPNGFAISQDHINVGFFLNVDDVYITSTGILPAPVSEKKTTAIHFFKMRLLQAEIRRVLYQRKRSEPKNEEHPWYFLMEQKLLDWLNASPLQPAWSKLWFTSRYNSMVIFLYRPSPQVPDPSARAATLCYNAAVHIIKSQNTQMDHPAVDVTWIFVLTLFMAVNTMLWTVSYPEIRSVHSKEEVEEQLDIAISIMVRCTERWPGTAGATQLYSTLGHAILKSYNLTDQASSSLSANSPASLTDATSPNSEHSSATTTSASYSNKPFDPPQFSYVFDQAPEQYAVPEYPHPLVSLQHPSFRSGSIFSHPASRQPDRRFSYFPPEFPQQLPSAWEDTPAPALNPQLNVPPPAASIPVTNPLIQATHFPSPVYSFGPQAFADQSYHESPPLRMGSLSQEQQRELMNHLETTGVSGINTYLDHPL
ncbi:MAG: hypothetical protein M1818_005238 [Claussenomyces sp. TS43310]|nr:MAG: hypothetical protein M1818_005238 [Claussenomyces sp. TS43310]